MCSRSLHSNSVLVISACERDHIGTQFRLKEIALMEELVCILMMQNSQDCNIRLPVSASTGICIIGLLW